MSLPGWTRDQAIEVLRRCREADLALNDVVRLAEGSLPDEEKRRIRRAFGNVIGEVHVEIEMPIYDAYPDLLPSYLDLSRPMNAADPD